MHYFTRIKLDTNKEKTMAALENPALFHGAIETALDYNPDRSLWRIDTVGGSKFLSIVSTSAPGTESLIAQFGDGTPADTKDYDKEISGIKDGDVLRFRLAANPTKQPNKKHGKSKMVSIASEDGQLEWLARKAEDNGFEPLSVDIKSCAWVDVPHKDGRIVYNAVVFEGLCSIADVEKVKAALTTGVGRKKAFGMGMLTVKECR